MRITRREFGKLAAAGSAWLGLSGGGIPLEAGDLLRSGVYVSTDTQCYYWCMKNKDHPHQPAIYKEIATSPVACWIGGTDPTAQVNNYLSKALAARKLGVMVAYNIPNRDLGSHSAGGAANAGAYEDWAIRFAKAIGNRPCMVILEPDSLMHMAGKPAEMQATQVTLLNSAIDAFAIHAPNAWIYADGGSGDWPEPNDIAPLIGRLHTRKLRGFSVNVSNYNTDAACAEQAAAIMKRLVAQGTPVKGWVYDTSRNGNGPAPDNAWCNPPGRKLGALAASGTQGADANLWIKLPGESDGECGAYPGLRAGAFSPVIAYNLIKGI